MKWGCLTVIVDAFILLLILIVVLMAMGCQVPIKKLEAQYFECTSYGTGGCNEIAKELDERYESKRKRELAEAKRIERRCGWPNVCIDGETWNRY